MRPFAGLSAYYNAPINAFRETQDDIVLGILSRFGADKTQEDAWRETLAILRQALAGLAGHLCLEFVVPRLGSRIDAVVLLPHAIVVLEFKVGQDRFLSGDFNQAWDYALDLKNFHSASPPPSFSF